MKTLYLVRHAKSSWKYPELDDFERPLNKRGRRDAPLMGKVLAKRGVAPDLIVTSPANRAAMTARIIAHGLGFALERIRFTESAYTADYEDYLEILEQVDEGVAAVMLVGHNPGLTRLANSVADHPVGNIPTSAVYCAELDIETWGDIGGGCGRFSFFEYPKLHARKR
jgi:phosphohistidine phosphatase